MKIIYDKVWGDIPMSDLAISIIDTPMYHRMSYIKQTSMAYRVFPTATHTRLNHQIGVYGLLKKTLNALIIKGDLVISGECPLSLEDMTDRVRDYPYWAPPPCITKDEFEWICLGGLLHDLGHGPASHTFDDLIEELTEKNRITNTKWRTHEERSQELFRYMVKQYNINISQEGVDYICNVINPPVSHQHDFRFQFVNNEVNGVDTDKMDYICRDCMVFGIASNVNIERIIDNSSIVYDDTNNIEGSYWSFSERVKNEVFNLFMMRYQLYRDIYNHPKVIKFEIAYKAVLTNNIEIILECFNTENVCAFMEMTDESMFWRANAKVRKEFINRDTYNLVPNNTIENPIVIEETVGFFGKCGFNPFQYIRFHDRNTYDVKRIPLSQINIFLCFDRTCEVLHYEYNYQH